MSAIPHPLLEHQLAFLPMDTAHLAAVDAIEQVSFPTPRSFALYTAEITQNRLANYWVIEPAAAHGELPPVLAYGGYWLTGDEAHIVVIASHPAWRRQRLGQWLLLEMAAAAREQGAATLTLEVRHHNQAARAFYAELGFAEVGLRKRYYRDTNEDAHLLTLFDLADEAHWRPLAHRLAQLRATLAADGGSPAQQ
jgi:ribosomal-protein-alanine N-acetyltransferase